MAIWSRRGKAERLLWTRDSRLAARVALRVGGSRIVELESGFCLIGPAGALPDDALSQFARPGEVYGLVDVDEGRPAAERYLYALASAVQVSGIADRIGMDQSPLVAQTKLLDLFLSLQNIHEVRFQPIVDLATLLPHEWECLFRPVLPRRSHGIGDLIEAAIATKRTAELDMYLIERILARASEFREATPEVPFRIGLNFSPASLLDPRLSAAVLVQMVRDAGLTPRQVTVESTEQQATPDMAALKRATRDLRRAGFGVAVDDAGAGYASFTLIAALRPTYIKIDREIVQGVARNVAKRALVEAFVSFSRKIGARVIAEGIEKGDDLAVLVAAGVDFGQGYLLGRPDPIPRVPRQTAALRAIRRRGAVAPPLSAEEEALARAALSEEEMLAEEELLEDGYVPAGEHLVEEEALVGDEDDLEGEEADGAFIPNR
jgi:EAL domain-containing protein (putative c-di-GMP-specific phosphodiesterase class I)